MARCLFNIWPFTSMEICPTANIFAKVNSKCCQILPKSWHVIPKDLICCQSGENSSNLVTLVSTLIESRKREGGKNERECSLKCHLNTENYLAWRRIVSASNWRTLTIGGSILYIHMAGLQFFKYGFN